MGLSDPSAIEQWLRSRGQSDVIRPHAWNFLQDGPGGEDLNDKPSARCVPHLDSSGVSHFPGSRDLYRPQWTCPGDSAYWREMQEKRLASKSTDSPSKRRR